MILAPLVWASGARWCVWVKSFAAFKKNVSVAYAWEPVIIKAARKPVVSGRIVMRDWIQEPITLERGLCGAKPERVCHWAFRVVGAEPSDELVDLTRYGRGHRRMADVAISTGVTNGRVDP